MNFEDVLYSRRSVRSYTGEKPSKEEIRKLLLAAQSAPIGCREYERYRITVIEDPALLGELENAHAECIQKPCMHALYSAPVLIVFSAQLSGGVLDNRYYSSAACMAEHVHLQASALGLGSCLLWGVIRSANTRPEIVEKLGLPEGFTPVCSVAVGKTEKSFPIREVPENRIPVDLL